MYAVFLSTRIVTELFSKWYLLLDAVVVELVLSCQLTLSSFKAKGAVTVKLKITDEPWLSTRKQVGGGGTDWGITVLTAADKSLSPTSFAL